MFGFLSRLFPWTQKSRPAAPSVDAADLPLTIGRLTTLLGNAGSLDNTARQSLADAFFAAGIECLKARLPGEAAFALSHAADLGCAGEHLQYNLALAYERSGQAKAADDCFRLAMSRGGSDAQADGFCPQPARPA